MQLPLEWLIPAGLLLVAGVIALHFYYEKKRREKMAQIAQDLGFTFAKKCPGPDEIGLGHLDLFQLGRGQRGQNMISGKLEDVGVAIFDYQYTTGHGKSQTTHRQTVATFKLPVPAFPAFQLRREHMFHKVGKMFGYQDINFPDYPQFSKQCLLRSNSEEATRQFFTEEVIGFFEQLNEKWSIEAAGQTLAVYQPSKRVKPAQLTAFFEKSSELFLTFPTA